MERQAPGVRAIFDQAREIDSPGERAAFLDRACAGAPDIRGEVEALLRAGEEAGSFLETPAAGRLAGGLAAGSSADDTRTAPSSPDDGGGLDFLEPSDKPGSIGRLGYYEVREVVGRGGMGIVLRAFDETLHRVVAIKVMAPQLATSATARRRFTREARAAAAVTHDHVVTIHAVEDAGPLPYIVMQFVAGTSLQDRLDQSGPLPLAEILRIGMQAASGLAAAHAQGLVHRDVKPANILLENGVERVKLTDFGLARAADDASLTQSGTVAGTPEFMSPEQAEGKPVDHRSDLFSLGSVLYAMCTGRPPFRAGTSMGVLKRVCEDTPTPVREANPEVPDWLAGVVEKLHAKDPAARFQSAAEVAELLGRHLAHVQHPSVVQADASPPPGQPATRKRWAVAAAALAAVLATLGTTEATGVTNVRATAIRIFTPEGMLVVETDDPAVKVIVEGDGDLVITGAGPQEVRLKAGSYRLKATKDGKPVKLDRDLVAISRGDRQIVRVRLEDEPPVAVAPKAEMSAFVLLGGKGVAERKFDTLAEAVLGSADGDTIEVRGNGPFVTDHIRFRHALTVRAGTGFRPVLTAVPGNEFPWGSLLVSFAPLRLEGLEVHGDSKAYRILDAHGPLWVANCRFLVAHPEAGICIGSHAACVVQNCEMVSAGAALDFQCDSEATSVVTNNLLIGQVNLWERDHSKGVTFQFTGNTHVSAVCNAFLHGTLQQARTTDPLEKRVHLSVTNNVITCGSGPYGFVQNEMARPHLSGKDAELWVRRRLDWRDENNSYQVVRGHWIQINSDGVVHTTSHKTLADWNAFWGLKSTGSSEGVIRFLGGDLISRAQTQPLKLTAEDVRLRPDSAGYRAGKDGKDLGADIDLVGPGPAYERWKKTPEYQQWLKDTGQVKK
jgi:hypothetical protein